MIIRQATITDVHTISSLVNYYARQDRMLFRSMANIYKNLLSFMVAEENDKVLGCCTLEVIWADLAEIKSLAVEKEQNSRGIGKALIKSAIEKAKQLHIARLFALTLEPAFFEKLGFEEISKQKLPMKVWKDCAECPKQDHCDETAVIIRIV